jgi:hypothetical protein
MEDSVEIIAHRLVAKNKSDQVVSIQFVAPDKAQYARRLLFEEGFDVEETQVNELPEGVELDVK